MLVAPVKEHHGGSFNAAARRPLRRRLLRRRLLRRRLLRRRLLRHGHSAKQLSEGRLVRSPPRELPLHAYQTVERRYDLHRRLGDCHVAQRRKLSDEGRLAWGDKQRDMAGWAGGHELIDSGMWGELLEESRLA